jgi:long-chain acyl-CoA synthetase
VTVQEGCVVHEEALLDYCRKNLAPYKLPKVEFMKDLPKNSTGKIMKKELPRK